MADSDCFESVEESSSVGRGYESDFSTREKANILAEAFANVSSSSNYSEAFISHKEHIESLEAEKLKEYFSENSQSYNEPFTLNELQDAIADTSDTSPGKDKLCTNTTPGLRSTAQAGTKTCSRCCSGDLCNAEGCGEQGFPKYRGPICYNCQQSRNPDKCDSITVCGRDDACHIEQQEEFGDIFYATKCISKHLCSINGGSIFGKRSGSKRNGHRNSISYTTSKHYNSTRPWYYETTEPHHHWTTLPRYNTTHYTTKDWRNYSTTTQSEFVAASGHYGNLFAIFFMPNHQRTNTNISLELLITSPYTNYNVKISSQHNGLQLTGQANGHVIRTHVPNTLQSLGKLSDNAYNIYDTGISISSNKPIFVAAMNEYSCCSGEAFSAIPVKDIRRNYIIATYPEGTKSVGVVAIEDNTSVRAKLQPGNSTMDVHIKYAFEGVLFTSDDVDISTGGTIESDKPIAVLSGNMDSLIHRGDRNFQTEMLIPTDQFAQRYIVPKIANAKHIILRIVARDPFSTVYITGKNGFYKNTYKQYVNELELSNDGYFINAQRPVMVTLYTIYESSTVNPFMTLLPAVDHFSSNYVITTPTNTNYTNYVTVIISSKDNEDGLRLNGGNLLFHAVDVTPVEMFRTVYKSISVSLNAKDTSFTISHIDKNVKFGLLVYGYKYRSAYGYPGGFSLTK
ncbi:uncharacterized protein LOC127719271 [Mytilus californianus]|uniref:uncharacterized protein LOC127719271 n=1 Tax=Mytilus californianus TaxID=6549 RepID=UPI002247894C|nr:uncharacterized protein LOC127719271 [Mytilus californianus]